MPLCTWASDTHGANDGAGMSVCAATGSLVDALLDLLSWLLLLKEGDSGAEICKKLPIFCRALLSVLII